MLRSYIFLLSYLLTAPPNGIMVNMIASMIQASLLLEKTYLLIILPIHGTRGRPLSGIGITSETALSALPSLWIIKSRWSQGHPLTNLAGRIQGIMSETIAPSALPSLIKGRWILIKSRGIAISITTLPMDIPTMVTNFKGGATDKFWGEILYEITVLSLTW